MYYVSSMFTKANDMYLEMAIGNAPWPIGVTMVGIHARTGREKIFAQNVARILHCTDYTYVLCILVLQG